MKVADMKNSSSDSSELRQSGRIRTARHVADMPLSNPVPEKKPPPSLPSLPTQEAPVAGYATPDPPAPQKRLVSIRILPPKPDEINALTSAQIAQILIKEANDPNSALRNTKGLEGIYSAFLAPRGMAAGMCATPFLVVGKYIYRDPETPN